MLFFRSESACANSPVFDLVQNGSVTLCFRAEVLAEIRDVLTRPKLVAKYPALTPEAVDEFIAKYLRAAHWVDNPPEHFLLSRDPKDSKYLSLAIEAGAPFLVTTDLDLLELMRSDSAEAQVFRRRFPSLQILTPAQFESAVASNRT